MRAISLSARRRRRISVIRFLVLIVPAVFAIPPAHSQQPDFKAVAAHAAHAVEESKTESVVVLDFVGPDTYVSELGRNMADLFSASLANVGGDLVVIDHAKIRQAVESNRFAPVIVGDAEITAWLAQSIGAKLAISGHLRLLGDTMQLTISCIRVEDAEFTFSFRENYPLTDEWRGLMAKNVDPDAGVVSLDKPAKPADPMLPTCISCPKPQFTQAALDKKYQGTVVMLVVVGKDGMARDIKVGKGLGYGMDLAAVQAVQKWMFNPGRGPDGEPMDVQVPIEVMFRLYK